VAVRSSLAGPLPAFFHMQQEPLASYEVILDEAAGDAMPGLRLDRVDGDSTTVLQTHEVVGIGSARTLRWQNSTTSTVDVHQVRLSSPSCGTGCGADDAYRLRAYETTGRIARFNNAGTQVTVLIVQNTTDRTVDCQVHFWNGSGNRLTFAAFSLAPHVTNVVQTQSLAPLPGQAGSITITHTGGYGALTGKSVAVEPSTGFSFDSPLTYRPR
jgi:hypothetical protein